MISNIWMTICMCAWARMHVCTHRGKKGGRERREGGMEKHREREKGKIEKCTDEQCINKIKIHAYFKLQKWPPCYTSSSLQYLRERHGHQSTTSLMKQLHFSVSLYMLFEFQPNDLIYLLHVNINSVICT